ncbi:hypothetical protein [Lactococcus raffinolactis]|uniref:hypothetical protein n=1 Tax=Pseudolactococcus raffinolactis TaxID=1366 RepID=UPI0039B0E07B
MKEIVSKNCIEKRYTRMVAFAGLLAAECVSNHFVNNVMIDTLSGRLRTPQAHKIILKIIDDFKLR